MNPQIVIRHETPGDRLLVRGAMIALILLWSVGAAAAEAAAPDGSPAGDVEPDGPPPGQTSAPVLVLAGLAAGAVGFAVGAGIGVSAGSRSDDEFAGMEAAYYVGSTLGALGLAGGMEVANYGRGDCGLVMLTSLGVGVAGYVALVATKNWTVLPVTVLAQLALTATVEQATASHNLREKQEDTATSGPGATGSWTLAGGPTPNGFGLAVRGRF